MYVEFQQPTLAVTLVDRKSHQSWTTTATKGKEFLILSKQVLKMEKIFRY